MKTIKKITVSNMEARSGEVPNQFVITTPEGVYFQSYSSTIAFEERKTGNTYLDKNKWDYSNTTGKYRNQFLGFDIKETRERIAEGRIKLVNLN